MRNRDSHDHDNNERSHERGERGGRDRGRERSRSGERGGRRGGGRMRRGDMRALLLAGLLDGPAHGYELMKRLEETTGGRWRPSPGSIYPMLQLLEDEGLIRGREDDGRRVYELTELGTGEADRSKLDAITEDEEEGEGSNLRNEIRLLHLAARQVGVAGTSEQVDKAAGIVRGARQSLYRLLTD